MKCVAAQGSISSCCRNAAYYARTKRKESGMPIASSQNLVALASSLYQAGAPNDLYHYTSLDAVVGISEKEGLRATKIQYLSDFSEIKHAFSMFQQNVGTLRGVDTGPQELLSQLSEWLRMPMRTSNATAFVTCFTEKRDSLSQWRGYTPTGRGACVQLRAEQLLACAKEQSYDFVKCVYTDEQKMKLAAAAVEHLVVHALSVGPGDGYVPNYRPASIAASMIYFESPLRSSIRSSRMNRSGGLCCIMMGLPRQKSTSELDEPTSFPTFCFLSCVRRVASLS